MIAIACYVVLRIHWRIFVGGCATAAEDKLMMVITNATAVMIMKEAEVVGLVVLITATTAVAQ